MLNDRTLSGRLTEIASRIDVGGPVRDALPLGVPLLEKDGSARAVGLRALGYHPEGAIWVRGDDRLPLAIDTEAFGEVSIRQLEDLRSILLRRAASGRVPVLVPSMEEVVSAGLDFENHPVRWMLTEQPNLRLIVAPGAGLGPELDSLMAVGAASWSQAMRIALDSHAALPPSRNAAEKLRAMQARMLRCTSARDRRLLLEELAGRYGRLHSELRRIEADDEEFRAALEPYLRKAFFQQ